MMVGEIIMELHEFGTFNQFGAPVRAYERGELIKDFRGDEWVYLGVADAPSPGKSGRVRVMVPSTGEPTGRDNERVFYPTVFDAVILPK
jgi:hypothetical protein